jgi:hypothetical protein
MIHGINHYRNTTVFSESHGDSGKALPGFLTLETSASPWLVNGVFSDYNKKIIPPSRGPGGKKQGETGSIEAI